MFTSVKVNDNLVVERSNNSKNKSLLLLEKVIIRMYTCHVEDETVRTVLKSLEGPVI